VVSGTGGASIAGRREGAWIRGDNGSRNASDVRVAGERVGVRDVAVCVCVCVMCACVCVLSWDMAMAVSCELINIYRYPGDNIVLTKFGSANKRDRAFPPIPQLFVCLQIFHNIQLTPQKLSVERKNRSDAKGAGLTRAWPQDQKRYRAVLRGSSPCHFCFFFLIRSNPRWRRS